MCFVFVLFSAMSTYIRNRPEGVGTASEGLVPTYPEIFLPVGELE